jgi:hypothetical protein
LISAFVKEAKNDSASVELIRASAGVVVVVGSVVVDILNQGMRF